MTFRWKDYREKGHNRYRSMTLAAREFMRRFLLHVLPGGLHRIRHYGLPLLITVMLLTLLCNFAQMAIWAALFMFSGEFSDFATALYHSAVNFITPGYGDIVTSKQWRMLGPIEAANGILMFGVSTSVMTAAVMDVIKCHQAQLQQE